MLTRLSAAEMGRRLASRDVSAVELAQAHLDRIREMDADLGAFLKVDEERVLEQARKAQAMIDAGGAPPLAGVPVAVKDNMSTEGLETTCASRILEGYVPPFDATVVARLKAAGMPVLGKTNLDEFAMGTSTEHSAFRVTRNPWDRERSPGGSSGGSAAAVAAELAPLSLGSDTGGSIRQPAALCGIVGFKPTYGRCSRYGLVAFGSSLDQIGPFGRTVEDAALLAEAITGHDLRDSTSLDAPPISCVDIGAGSLKGLTFAVPREMSGRESGVSDEVSTVIEQARAELEREGVRFKDVELPSARYGVTTYYIIAPAEASSNLARFDGIRYGPRIEGDGHIGMVERTRGRLFGHEVKTRIMIGTYALSAGYYDAYYLRAQKVRAAMQRELAGVLRECDAIFCPTSPVTAFRLGELMGDPMALKVLDLCTIPANLGGNPAISLPCGFAAGLPVGLQLMGAPMGDERLLQIASAVERALPAATARPPLP